jgi:hypothetical protein
MFKSGRLMEENVECDVSSHSIWFYDVEHLTAIVQTIMVDEIFFYTPLVPAQMKKISK